MKNGMVILWFLKRDGCLKGKRQFRPSSSAQIDAAQSDFIDCIFSFRLQYFFDTSIILRSTGLNSKTTATTKESEEKALLIAWPPRLFVTTKRLEFGIGQLRNYFQISPTYKTHTETIEQ